MALPAWGGFPGFRVLEVVEQNLAGFHPVFPPFGGDREGGGLSQRDAQVQSLRIWI